MVVPPACCPAVSASELVGAWLCQEESLRDCQAPAELVCDSDECVGSSVGGGSFKRSQGSSEQDWLSTLCAGSTGAGASQGVCDPKAVPESHTHLPGLLEVLVPAVRRERSDSRCSQGSWAPGGECQGRAKGWRENKGKCILKFPCQHPPHMPLAPQVPQFVSEMCWFM